MECILISCFPLKLDTSKKTDISEKELAAIVAAEEKQNSYYQTIEHGTYGGNLLSGNLFGFSRNPSCMIDAPSQFDFYSGGGLDTAFLGFGQIDCEGNVNVSKLAGVTVGPGGFIDIAQNARKVVFCGTFDTKGTEIKTGHGKLELIKTGKVCKLVNTIAKKLTCAGLETHTSEDIFHDIWKKLLGNISMNP